jgi:hypothetical protein
VVEGTRRSLREPLVCDAFGQLANQQHFLILIITGTEKLNGVFPYGEAESRNLQRSTAKSKMLCLFNN